VPHLFADISISLDGYVAGPNPTLEEPLGAGGDQLHEWVVHTRTFKELHGQEGGDVDSDDELFAEAVRAQGAIVMGRRMFSGGDSAWEDDPNNQGWWGDEPPFHKPVFVLTHYAREPLVLGETTFTFVTDGIGSAIQKAGAAAGDKNVAVAGGANVIQQTINAGLLDELTVHLVPVLLGGGIRLFENLEPARLGRTRLDDSPTGVTHLELRMG
jgi:dihydrofolate reductase